MLEKYDFLSAFGSNKQYEDYHVDEINHLLAIHNRINEVKNICMERNSKI